MTDTSSLRWHLKKLARKGVALSWSALGGGSTSSGVASKCGVRALTYHRFGRTLRDPFCVDADEFARQMELVAALGVAVSLSDVEAFIAGRGELVDGAVLVTIDDGCPSTYRLALPILQRYGIPAVAFVPAGEMLDGGQGTVGSSDDSADDRMTWDEVESLARAGVTIASHGWAHRSFGRMPAADAREHAARSREAIARHTGRDVTAFAYPFGTRADYNAATAEILRAAGYTCAFTSRHGMIDRDSNAFELPRVKVEGGEALWLFRLLIEGGLDRWEWVDRVLWRVQAAG